MHGDVWHAQNDSRMSEISRILLFQLFTLQDYKWFKTQNENGKKSLGKLLRLSFYPIFSKLTHESIIVCSNVNVV